MMVRVKRAYDPPEAGDGLRVLVDRLWPRGLRRADAAIDRWLKEVAPSTALRAWFAHDPARWDEFRRRYADELPSNAEAVAYLVEQGRARTLTLLYAAKDAEHNNAVALREYLLGHRAAG